MCTQDLKSTRVNTNIICNWDCVYLFVGACVCVHVSVCLSVCAGGEVPCEAQINLELNPSS